MLAPLPNRTVRGQVTDELAASCSRICSAMLLHDTATKYGYFDGAFGRRGTAGTSNQSRRISLANGQRVRDARIEMLKPAAITGTVERSGSPLVDVTVRAYVESSSRCPSVAAAQSATTDDRGEDRLSGLAPGRTSCAFRRCSSRRQSEILAVPQPFTPDALSRDSAFRRDPAFAFDPVHRLISAASSPPLPAAVSGKSQAYPLTFYPRRPNDCRCGRHRRGMQAKRNPPLI